jgi:hypothetical protein
MGRGRSIPSGPKPASCHTARMQDRRT